MFKNTVYLVIAVLFFGLAYFVYWLVTDGAVPVAPEQGATRSLSPQAIQPPSQLMAFVQQWQPILTLLSSLGGIVSFVLQVRVWMRKSG